MIDLFSRRVVGCSLKAEMNAHLIADPLVMAIWRCGKPDAVLRHSGRGSHYPIRQLQAVMRDNGATCAMSQAGIVWDIAAMKRFSSSSPTERVRRQIYRTRDAARDGVFAYSERF